VDVNFAFPFFGVQKKTLIEELFLFLILLNFIKITVEQEKTVKNKMILELDSSLEKQKHNLMSPSWKNIFILFIIF
jgi:hypothetical protein